MRSKNILAITAMVFGLAACAFSNPNFQETKLSESSIIEADKPVEQVEMELVEVEKMVSNIDLNLGAELGEEEIEGLLFMREEEKLARDVYLYLYQVWGTQVFQNIAQSEETHTQAVLTLIDRYGLEDPANSTVQGEFVNPDLQSLYNQLIEKGSISLKDAFMVGAAIEEIDIMDIETYISQTTHTDIIRVYENLIKGSVNHLQAFVRNISNQIGETYTPQYMTLDEYSQIINASADFGQNQFGRKGRN